MLRHTVRPEESGERADVIVARVAGVSRSVVAEAVKRRAILHNGKTAKGSTAVNEGDVLEFALSPRSVIAVRAEAIDLNIIYEDSEIIVVDKPAGMVTHPAFGSTSGTLVNALLAHVPSLPGDQLRPGLVHRLDRDTSGVLVVAKTSRALTALGRAMKQRGISREYLGLVSGMLQYPKGTLDGAIGRDPRNRLKYTVTSDGKPAITHYEILEPLKHACEVRFRLETGRTHQIRVHMAALGNPLINDPVYGKAEQRFPLAGQALHAWRLRFRHPLSGRELEFEAPVPKEYAATKALLRE